MRALVLISVLLLVLLPVHANAAPGAYVGVGPSSACRSDGTCQFRECGAQIVLRPSHLEGRWAADLLTVIAYDVPPCESTLTGSVHWPSHVLDDLEGSPETGFHASGRAQVTGTSNGIVYYRLGIAPLSSATSWSLLVDGDSTFGSPMTWSGLADFRGVELPAV